ncbi:hypothetical protein P4B35_19305 [Pontiellaceae bacterium B12227]|nr:hypothetical protein [Pontiellaceae bacterium B12227]
MFHHFKNRKIKKTAIKEVDKIVSTARDSSNLMLPLPTFIAEAAFELSFLYYFLHDYRIFHKYDQSLRETISDEFINRMSRDMGNHSLYELIEAIYNERITAYFQMVENSETMGDFIQSSSQYVESLIIYSRKEKGLPCYSPNDIEEKVRQIAPEEIGSLAEPIAVSISIHSAGLLH